MGKVHKASQRFIKAKQECMQGLSELKQSIQMLNHKLLLGDWQLQNLREYRYFPPSKLHQMSTPNETAAYKTVAPLLPLGPGNLLVHDKDCSELHDRLRPPSGFYRIKPEVTAEPFLVYCDMEDGGGWTVFQKRRNGKVDFNRDWAAYRDGFGNYEQWNDEFWLGNENIHSLLTGDEYLLKIDLMDWKGETNYAIYDNFKISDEKDQYRLSVGTCSGQAGDGLSGGTNMVEQWSASLGGMQFSTRDQDNDRYLQGNCAEENMGGWWYNRCHAANLNGKFYRGGEYKAKNDNGVVWGTWRGLWYSLRHTTMKVRPQHSMDGLGSGAGSEG
ncbi:fibrinogen like 1B isoform X3 [Clupea harengus]|uniref:Fibrinogen like 1B isoform X3 n=1 Tax=Clupea harengus TaxID=7950 RepID=A0A8M1KK71_CLUHA|nr:fibrinogen like 1B isoform X3 [Clupea harengus]